MKSFLESIRLWTGAPQIFWMTALASTVLLVLLEGQTPWDITYTAVGDGGFAVTSTARPAWALIGSLLLVIAPVVALRSVTLAMLLVVPRVAMGLAIGFAWPWTGYAALLAVAVCTSWRRPRTAWVVAATATALPITAIASRGRMMTPGGSVEFGLEGVGGGASWLPVTSGLYVAASILVLLLTVLLRREAARERDLFDLVRGRREVAHDAAVLGERARLARDLHDVVAHHVSLIAVRAETAPYVYPDTSADTRSVLAEIADESRKALDELRSVLDVLRRSDGEHQRLPQPAAVTIARLVADAQSARVDVHSSLKGLETVHSTPGYVAYRVVQEALSNARRHAPEETVSVTAHGDGAGGINVLVSNRAVVTAPPEPGRGLVGMAERVSAARGQLVTEMNEGHFIVRADLPGENSSGPHGLETTA